MRIFNRTGRKTFAYIFKLNTRFVEDPLTKGK